MSETKFEPVDEKPVHQPIFNLPGIITAIVFLLLVTHLIKAYVIADEFQFEILLLGAAIPARYGEFASQIPYQFAAYYTPLSHAFIHGDWIHLLVNLLWMLAFGAAVARRFGALRFIAFTITCVLCGFGLHLVTHFGDTTPMIGASGAVSGYMGAASRFAFIPGPGGLAGNIHRPSLTLFQSFGNRGFVVFVGIWFVINYITGTGLVSAGGEEISIAWEAHVGGFLAGLLLFSIFDRKFPEARTN